MSGRSPRLAEALIHQRQQCFHIRSGFIRANCCWKGEANTAGEENTYLDNPSPSPDWCNTLTIRERSDQDRRAKRQRRSIKLSSYKSCIYI
jgi:hypothetical protein